MRVIDAGGRRVYAYTCCDVGTYQVEPGIPIGALTATSEDTALDFVCL